MIDLEQLKKSNDEEWHKPYGGQITLNCEDVDVLLKIIDKACEELEKRKYHCKWDYINGNCPYSCCNENCKYCVATKGQWKDYLLGEVSK